MNDKEILLEQYKIAVEMADRVSARRKVSKYSHALRCGV